MVSPVPQSNAPSGSRISNFSSAAKFASHPSPFCSIKPLAKAPGPRPISVSTPYSKAVPSSSTSAKCRSNFPRPPNPTDPSQNGPAAEAGIFQAKNCHPACPERRVRRDRSSSCAFCTNCAVESPAFSRCINVHREGATSVAPLALQKKGLQPQRCFWITGSWHQIIHNQKPVIPTEAARRLFFALVPRVRRAAQWRDLGLISTRPKNTETQLHSPPHALPHSETAGCRTLWFSRVRIFSCSSPNHRVSAPNQSTTKNLSSRPEQFVRLLHELRSGGTCFFYLRSPRPGTQPSAKQKPVIPTGAFRATFARYA